MKRGAPLLVGLGLALLFLVPWGSAAAAPATTHGSVPAAATNACSRVVLKVGYSSPVLRPGQSFAIMAEVFSASQPGTPCPAAGIFVFQGPLVPHGFVVTPASQLVVAHAPGTPGFFPTTVGAQLSSPANAGRIAATAAVQVL